MSEIILHHYPQSPVSEKVRVGLGIKRLAWASVEMPRLPPKPDLVALTGGYRRAPVMQIGADIYCDSQCILRELQRRYPQPTFYPGGGDGLPWALSRWTDGELFTHAAAIVLGHAPAKLPPEFAADRGRLYFGPDWNLERLHDDLPHIVAQLRGALGWLDQRLSGGRTFVLGSAPGLPDAACYYIVWFLRGRWDAGAKFLSEFPALCAWEDRVRTIGHGTSREMQSSEAIAIARETEQATTEGGDPNDPQGITPGLRVSVVPITDSGDVEVVGIVRAVDRETIAVLRDDPRVGTVCVHFPRVGYRVHLN
jgi:glutathione S-transferase